MTKVHFITTDSGEELVIMSKREFERLLPSESLEDEGTARIVAQSRADVRAGRDVVLPRKIAMSIVEGRNAIQTIREWRGLTKDALASAGKMTLSQLSELEAGTRQGSVETITNLAAALSVPRHLLLP